MVAQQTRLSKVQQCPEILQCILHWRAGQQHPTPGSQSPQAPVEQCGDVLHAMRLVTNHNVPCLCFTHLQQLTWRYFRLLRSSGRLLILGILLYRGVSSLVLLLPRPLAAFAGHWWILNKDLEQLVGIAQHRVRSEQHSTQWRTNAFQGLCSLTSTSMVDIHWPAGAPKPSLLLPLAQKCHRQKHQSMCRPSLPSAVQQGA
mmetsp:Transcript_9912/g.22187  ORF Transcript_9912/g.22187 Transcript_9912/m.22187 type:complete len:201 (-) Transcript_9912:918-1520(-)